MVGIVYVLITSGWVGRDLCLYSANGDQLVGLGGDTPPCYTGEGKP